MARSDAGSAPPVATSTRLNDYSKVLSWRYRTITNDGFGFENDNQLRNHLQITYDKLYTPTLQTCLLSGRRPQPQDL